MLTLYVCSWPHFKLENGEFELGSRLRFQVLILCGCPIYGVRDRNLPLEVPRWPHFNLETNTLNPRLYFEISSAHFIYV